MRKIILIILFTMIYAGLVNIPAHYYNKKADNINLPLVRTKSEAETIERTFKRLTELKEEIDAEYLKYNNVITWELVETRWISGSVFNIFVSFCLNTRRTIVEQTFKSEKYGNVGVYLCVSPP